MVDDHTEDFGPVVDTNKAFEYVSTLDTTSRLWVLSVDTFHDMKDDHCSMVRN